MVLSICAFRLADVSKWPSALHTREVQVEDALVGFRELGLGRCCRPVFELSIVSSHPFPRLLFPPFRCFLLRQLLFFFLQLSFYFFQCGG